MINVLKKIKRMFKRRGKLSHAQGGEDMVLNTLFAGKQTGKYIDIGANSPYEQSNTAYFYNKGWSGYNVDANPKAIELLNTKRKRDLNINAFISDERSMVNYHLYEQSLYNGANDPEQIPSKLIGTLKVESLTFNDIVEKYQINEDIDFISIDVEGFDFQVLQSINLGEIKPKAIVIESFDYLVSQSLESEITSYLKKHNYLFVAKTITNSIYISEDFYTNRFIK